MADELAHRAESVVPEWRYREMCQRVEHLIESVEILYTAHKMVNFDTEEDHQRQQELLRSVVEILGYDPALTDGGDERA